jgi:hypothetical protein
MLIEALFITAKRETSKRDAQINWYVHTIEYYSTIKIIMYAKHV